jgi:hypothetical protein
MRTRKSMALLMMTKKSLDWAESPCHDKGNLNEDSLTFYNTEVRFNENRYVLVRSDLSPSRMMKTFVSSSLVGTGRKAKDSAACCGGLLLRVWY